MGDLERVIAHLQAHQIEVEPVRLDELTGRRFTFFADPDGLPLELYEAATSAA
ncbi:putative lyase [compost metagenome]